jgi:hypothetical protein
MGIRWPGVTSEDLLRWYFYYGCVFIYFLHISIIIIIDFLDNLTIYLIQNSIMIYFITIES